MKEVELREDEYVCIRKDTYDRLLDIETRVDVLVDLLAADKHVDVELELRILGTELAITTANEIKASVRGTRFPVRRLLSLLLVS